MRKCLDQHFKKNITDMKNVLICIFIVLFFNSCQYTSEPIVDLGLFDISKDDSRIIFSLYDKR